MAIIEIRAKYKNQKMEEVVDTVEEKDFRSAKRTAEYLVGEYAMAFGWEWKVWSKRIK